MTTGEEIVAALAEIRRRRGISCAELDAHLELKPGTIAKMEAGHRGNHCHSLRLHLLTAIAHALGVRFAVLRDTGKHADEVLAAQGFQRIDVEKNVLRERASRGGRKRALMLSPKRRSEIARKAAFARWRPLSGAKGCPGR